MRRMKVNKYQDKKRFNRKASKTRAVNIAPPPMRGGYRM